MIRLTLKEIARSDAGYTIISRPQANGGFKVMAVRMVGLQGIGGGFVTIKRVS